MHLINDRETSQAYNAIAQRVGRLKLMAGTHESYVDGQELRVVCTGLNTVQLMRDISIPTNKGSDTGSRQSL